MLGTTPTRVGKGTSKKIRHFAAQDYSHSRGKRLESGRYEYKYRGLLPLAWEKDLVFTGKTSSQN